VFDDELGSCFFPPLPTGPKLLFFFFTGADNVVTYNFRSVV